MVDHEYRTGERETGEAPGVRVGMTQAEVVRLLGSPHARTTLGDVLTRTRGMKFVLGDYDPETEYWLYLDTPPGHNTELTLRCGRVVKLRMPGVSR